MAEKVVKTVRAVHKTNKAIGERVFTEVSWKKGGSWKKDYELVQEATKTAKGTKATKVVEGATAENQTDLELEALKAGYKEVYGRAVPPSKTTDKVYIQAKIDEKKAELKAIEDAKA